MICLRLCCAAFFLFLFFTSNGQYVPVTRYTTRDGMHTERITCMTQDSKGFMWFGTYFGIMRYDGYKWKKIEMPEQMKNKNVNCIRAAGEKIYAGIGFNGGFMVITKGRVQNIELPKPFTEVTHVTINKDSTVTVAVSDPLGDSKAVLKFSNEKFETVWNIEKPFNNITALASDHKQRTWIATEKGLLIVQNKYLLQIIEDTILKSISLNKNGSMVAISNQGQKTILRFFDADNLKAKTTVSTMDILLLPQFENNDSGSWGNKENQLIRIEESGKIHRYTFSMPHRTVTGPIFVDRENNIWFSTEAGLYKFANLSAQSFYFEEKGPTSTFILPVASQKIITNGFGFYNLTSSAQSKMKKVMPITDASCNMFLDKNNHVWVSQWAGRNGTLVYEIKKGKFTSKTQFDLNSSHFAQDKEGNVWTSGRGIVIYKGKEVLQKLPVDTPEKNMFLINFYLDESKQTIWAGTTYWGLLKLKYFENSNGKISLQLTDIIDQSKGLKDHTIRGNIIKDSKGRIWFGTRNSGAVCLTEIKGKYHIRLFSEKEGITCSRINWITEHRGYIWIAACDGVYQLNDFRVVRKYNTGDGLIEDYVLHMVFDADTLWAGTSEGITKILLTEQKSLVPPSVALSDVTVLGHSDSTLYNEGVSSFKAHQNSIGFTFTGNSYFDEKKMLYKYRLKGYDSVWTQPTAGNNINYASLPPGSYQFEVHAQNAIGTWSVKPATFIFEIIQPFYKSAWFIILCIVAVAFLILLIRQYRMQQKYKLEKLRLAIARDLHDDIGASLGTINILSKTAQRKIKTDKDAEAVVSKIGLTAQSTLESMDEIIWAINPVREKAIDLIVRMQNFAQPLLESEGIEFDFESDLLPKRKLEMNLKRNLYLIFKEIIYNAIKHAYCSKVEVRLTEQHNKIVLVVQDNGRGMKNDLTNKDRHGLDNIQSRAKAFGGDVVIRTKENAGTKVVVSVSAI